MPSSYDVGGFRSQVSGTGGFRIEGAGLRLSFDGSLLGLGRMQRSLEYFWLLNTPACRSSVF